jgi:hypothetical protein
VVLGALGAAYLATSLGQTSPVIAVAREVAWGQTVTAADLVEARVSADPALVPIPYAERDQVIGMVAATTLTPGSLLTREALTEQPLPPPGQQLVGVGVSAVQLPTTPLRPGDDVLLVPVAGSGGRERRPRWGRRARWRPRWCGPGRRVPTVCGWLTCSSTPLMGRTSRPAPLQAWSPSSWWPASRRGRLRC